VQAAYATEQSPTWTEGSAVWAVEQLYGDDNADFERFLPAFLGKTFRPLERPAGGFGDAYPYGAAQWPYFLELRFGADFIVSAWQESEQREFLDAIGAALTARSATLDGVFAEFTRWNAFTGARSATNGWPTATAWIEAPREPAFTAEGGRAFLEGLSARYVPFELSARSRIEVVPTNGIRATAWVVADGGDPTTGIELAGEPLEATLEPGRYTLVLTGLTPRTTATAVDIAIGPPEEEEIGCRSTRTSTISFALALLALLVARRRLTPHARS
jgi:hypothetical protein